MVAIRHFALASCLVALSFSSGRAGPVVSDHPDDSSLFAQAASEALNANFPSSNISYLLMDARTGHLLAARWDDPSLPVPMGSLLKPFTALAYGEQHNYHFPSHICRGTFTGCWLPRGHGHVDLTAAIAQSCNSYFRKLTADLTAADVLPTAARFGLDVPDTETSGPELAGLGNCWRTSPLHMARAYIELVHMRQQPGVSQILNGMALSAQHGTGQEVHRFYPFPDALAKTGTASCAHSRREPGDGFTVVLTPASDPQLLLLVRIHGVPGSHAAKIAGQMLRRVED